MNENDNSNLIENSKSEVLIGGEISTIDTNKIENQDINKNNDKDKESDSEKKILIYKKQSVSIFKLLYHLSGKLEIFLMIIGTISTIFSGCQYSLWGYIFGDTVNEITNIIDIDKLPEDEFNKELDKIETKVNKLVIYFLILAALTFIANFLMVSLWGYTALRQIHKLKQKYKIAKIFN